MTAPTFALADVHHAAIEAVRAGRVVYDFDARFDYVRDGVVLDFWDAAPFDDLIVHGHVRRGASGCPLVVTS